MTAPSTTSAISDVRNFTTAVWQNTPGSRHHRTTLPFVPDDRIHLIVLFGGQSAEHDVSRSTARHVLGAIDLEKYHVEAIGITREGRWVRADAAIAALTRGAAALPERLDPDGPAYDLLPAVNAPLLGCVPFLSRFHGQARRPVVQVSCRADKAEMARGPDVRFCRKLGPEGGHIPAA